MILQTVNLEVMKFAEVPNGVVGLISPDTFSLQFLNLLFVSIFEVHHKNDVRPIAGITN